MCTYATLNNDSMRLIENILVNAKSHPMYRGYDINLNFAAGYGAGAVGIDISRNGQPVNLFLFYPDFAFENLRHILGRTAHPAGQQINRWD